jgi:hypothetical protein
MQSPISATSTHPKNAGITSLLPDMSQVKGGTLYHGTMFQSVAKIELSAFRSRRTSFKTAAICHAP